MQNHVAELTRCPDRLGVAQLVVTSRLAGPADRARFGVRGHVHCGEDLAVLPLARLAARRHHCPLVATIHLSVRHALRRSPHTAPCCRPPEAPLPHPGRRPCPG
ncbi:MAG TPA: hypothetical protein VGH88_17180 [Streptosporangiaceae bacterium]